MIVCPKCGAEGSFTVWESVNIDINPEQKDRIFNEDIFIWICPECGAKVFVPMSFLYHDMTHKLMIFFDFNDEADSCEESDFGLLDRLSDLGGYRYRTVHGLMDLKEKIILADYGLSDVAVELMKYCIKHLMFAERFEDGDEIRFFALKKEENSDGLFLIFAILAGLEDKDYFKFPFSEYVEYVEKVNTDPRFDLGTSKCVEVCEKWVEYKLKQIC